MEAIICLLTAQLIFAPSQKRNTPTKTPSMPTMLVSTPNIDSQGISFQSMHFWRRIDRPEKCGGIQKMINMRYVSAFIPRLIGRAMLWASFSKHPSSHFCAFHILSDFCAKHVLQKHALPQNYRFHVYRSFGLNSQEANKGNLKSLLTHSREWGRGVC